MFFVDSFPFPAELEKILREFKASPQALAKLWPILAKSRGVPGKNETHYSLNSEMTGAYAAYYLPANALKIYFVLEEMRRLGLPLEKELRVVDFGAGPGSVLCGTAFWAKENRSKIQYSAWEQSKNFVQLGEQVSSELRKNFPVTAEWSLAKRSPFEFLKGREPHVVVFQNSVHEIFPDEAERNRELEKILSLLKRLGGPRYLILIEPALRDSTRDLLRTREALIDGKKAKVWLPCLDNRPCGALASPNDWCHEEIAVEFPEWFNKFGSSAGLKKESLLFSYSVLAHTELEVPDWHADGLRMVSQRLERKGQTECFLCTQRGKLKVRVQLSKTTDENRQLLEWVRGDLFSEVEIGESGDLVRAERLRRTRMTD